jgi:oxaloacetate decarboxylase gamma subunit
VLLPWSKIPSPLHFNRYFRYDLGIILTVDLRPGGDWLYFRGGFMTIVEMLEQSGILTLLGMGIVFGFLTVMIICITLLGKIVHALGADKDVLTPLPAAPSSGPAAGSGAAAAGAVAAAITAAVTEYRKTENR